MKEEFNREERLKIWLDEFEVKIPKELEQFKRSRWQRFMGYLASPTQDPLEEMNSTLRGFKALKILPIIGGIGITIFQLLMMY